jgi:uncharacterized protein (DUF4415 family)
MNVNIMQKNAHKPLASSVADVSRSYIAKEAARPELSPSAKPRGKKRLFIGKPSVDEMFKHYDGLRDEDIDTLDSPSPTPEMWSRARISNPRPKEQIAIRLDSDLLAWFKAQGAGYQTRMNAVLRIYMETQMDNDAKTL